MNNRYFIRWVDVFVGIGLFTVLSLFHTGGLGWRLVILQNLGVLVLVFGSSTIRSILESRRETRKKRRFSEHTRFVVSPAKGSHAMKDVEKGTYTSERVRKFIFVTPREVVDDYVECYGGAHNFFAIYVIVPVSVFRAEGEKLEVRQVGPPIISEAELDDIQGYDYR